MALKKSTITKIVFAFLLIGVLFNVGTSKASAATLREQLVSEAYKHIGKPYVWGGKGPNSFDCSGLTRYVYLQVTGKDIGGWTVPQESSGVVKSVSEAQPGDLLFWGSRGQSYHVAISLGSGQYIHAPQPGQTVTVGKTAWYAPSFAVDVTGNAGNESSGNVTNGWVSKNGKWHYYKDGSAQKGWLKLGSTWYFLDESTGEMATGWRRVGSAWYYFQAGGELFENGWLKLGTTWYYLRSGGSMVENTWQKVGVSWYYFGSGGNLIENDWLKLGSTWYYLRSGGSLVENGWFNLNGVWYYMNPGGSLVENQWLLLGNTWYYLNPGGSMVTNNRVINGTLYYFNQSGAWLG